MNRQAKLLLILSFLSILSVIKGNICSSSKCKCTPKHVICRLKGDTMKFDDKMALPDDEKFLFVEIQKNSQIYVSKSFLKNSRAIRSIQMIGEVNFKDYNSSVTIAGFDFKNSEGTEIEVMLKNISSVYLLEKSFESAAKLHIKLEIADVSKVEVHQKLFGRSSFDVSFNRVDNLIFSRKVFKFVSLKIDNSVIKILNSTVQDSFPMINTFY